jgi:rRNA maturation protein Nop10
MTNPVVSKNDKGRYSAKGTCAVCGGNMFKFMSEADAKGMM